jgi:hypothetical protein
MSGNGPDRGGGAKFISAEACHRNWAGANTTALHDDRLA